MRAPLKALRVLAGPIARVHLRERGLRPDDVRVIPAAAGGPKGLILNPLDRFLFGQWLPRGHHEVHLIGASIGSWRMASACAADADQSLAAMAHAYVHQTYDHMPGRAPEAALVSRVFRETLQQQLGTRADELLSHPRLRLHVVTSHGRGLLGREGRLRTPLGYGLAFAGNLLTRASLGLSLERVVFSDPRSALPLPLDDFRSLQRPLDAANLVDSVLASCSIPFWLKAVHDIPGGPAGAYWDGGITDYHLHWPYRRMTHGLALYPHFQHTLVPGWLDKALPWRHGSTSALDRVVVLAPKPEWVAGLPGAKLPDRADFQHYGDDVPARIRAWQAAIAQSQRLADEFAQLVDSGQGIDAEPL